MIHYHLLQYQVRAHDATEQRPPTQHHQRQKQVKTFYPPYVKATSFNSNHIHWFCGKSVEGSSRRAQVWAHPREMQPIGCLRDSVGRLRRSGGYVCLRMVFRRCAPLRSSNLVAIGKWRHARGMGHYRGEPGSFTGWVRTRFGRGGGQLGHE